MKTEGGLRLAGVSKQSTEGLPLVSIVTVVRNNHKTLGRTIESVLTQGYPNLEYVIVDGGSTDGTLEIIKQHADRLDYYVSEPDKGIYDAMNKGLALCTGQLIGIINADDWYEPGAIQAVAQCHVEDPECVVYGLVRSHDERGPAICGSRYASRLPEKMIPHPTCFIPATLYQRHGKFNPEYRIAGDYDLMLRLYTKGERFWLVEKVIANFAEGGLTTVDTFLERKELAKLRLANGVITPREYWIQLARAGVSLNFKRLARLLAPR